MQKLALKLDDLRVQSFDTMPAAPAGRGTIIAHQEESGTYDENQCTAACPLLSWISCATCDESGDKCESWEPCDTADPGRRVILY